jgi:DNA-binding GntR family transcriptional regulator
MSSTRVSALGLAVAADRARRGGRPPAGKPGPEKSSTASKVRQRLVDLILSGEIAPGQRLDQRQLARRLRTTTVPLREAMSGLEIEGLLVREPGRGVFCRVYTVPELEDMVEIRGVLEALAARRAATRATEEDIAELRTLAAKLGEPIAEGGEDEFVATHVALHSRIVEIARSPRLRALLEHQHLIDGVLANIAPTLWASRPQDHLGLVDAIASRDPARAERTMHEHITPMYEQRFVDLRKRFGEGPILLLNPYGR